MSPGRPRTQISDEHFRRIDQHPALFADRLAKDRLRALDVGAGLEGDVEADQPPEGARCCATGTSKMDEFGANTKRPS
jgi:hypothetical protein